jgi:hypothetical protein
MNFFPEFLNEFLAEILYDFFTKFHHEFLAEFLIELLLFNFTEINRLFFTTLNIFYVLTFDSYSSIHNSFIF